MDKPDLDLKLSIRMNSSYQNIKVITIEVEDTLSSKKFMSLTVTPENFCAALGGLSSVSCKGSVKDLERIGLKMEHKEFKFPLANVTYNFSRKDVAKKLVVQCCPVGWVPDTHFGSQSSFFKKDDKWWARTIIRRWVSE